MKVEPKIIQEGTKKRGVCPSASVAVADVPGAPVASVGGFQSCPDAIASGGLCFHLLADVVHDLLHERGGVLAVHEDAVSRGLELSGFVHVLSIATRGGSATRGVPLA